MFLVKAVRRPLPDELVVKLLPVVVVRDEAFTLPKLVTAVFEPVVEVEEVI